MNLNLSPTQPQNRIQQIDILRGFALLGVLMVNVFGYNASFFDFSGFYNSFLEEVQQKVFSLIVNYGADKFIGLFSLLFGLGFSMMYLKYASDETRFLKIYSKRLLVLMAFGVLHIVFFWAGDILFSYSILGFVLLLLRKQSSKLLLPLSVFIYFFPILYLALSVKLTFLPDALSSTSEIEMPEVIQIYSSGSYADVFKLRLHEYWSFRNINLIYYAPKVLSLFIFGFLFYKHDFITKINAAKSKYFILAIAFLLIGIWLNTYTMKLVNFLAQTDSNPYFTTWYMGIFEVTNVFLIASYLLLILILSQIKYFQLLLAPLKYIGRMSLTNYMSYSIIFTTLMYYYGFGQFGSFTPLELVIIAFIVFVVQLYICKIWLRYFSFGPMEWIWRRLTYRKGV